MKKYLKKIKGFFVEAFLVFKELLWTNTKIALVFYFAFLLNLVSWVAFWWLLKSGLSIIILHYNSFMGIDFLANFELGDSPWMVYIVPFCGTLLWLINLILCAILLFQSKSNKKRFNRQSVHYLGMKMIVGINLFLQIAIIIYVASIIMVNRF